MSVPANLIDLAAARAHHLSTQELEALTGAARGMTNGQMARALGVGEDTVKRRLRRVFRKLGAIDRASAVARAYDVGVLRTAAGRAVAS